MAALLLRLGRVIAYFGLTLPLMPVQAALIGLGSPLARRLPAFYHGLVCRVLGLRLERRGMPSHVHPTLFVANHTSYLDIEILGAAIEGSFISKAEVGQWPFFGWLAKLQRTVFVDRRVRSTAEQRDAIKERLEHGDNLILFPEATSGDGMHVLPFKSALFSVAEYAPKGEPLVVQPVSIAYVRLDGMPLGRFYRPFLAWYGDMTMGSHLWTMLGLGTVEVAVTFHPPVTFAAFGSRKAMAEYCCRVVSGGLSAALAGRPPVEDEAPDAPIGAAVPNVARVG
ncbi:MAG TPA: lysophospholipid acyltransferase family protein [Stellaceae bacterium]|nr:lysophospholipid acyltransferase family protein [Stellaceae bacterium]